MLKLKKLQILGFKSFCDRTELKFHGDGVAAIVGPNGCGKSNISDAISWVLGEQSAKTLRGSRMEDVIFAGTRDRKPTGMAEVSLTLIDPEVYDGPDANAELELDVRDEVPEDWDEASLRAAAAEEAERISADLQPGHAEESDSGPHGAEATNGNGAAPPAELVLKIRRRRLKAQPVRAGEIMVTRRLFRTGDSEYLLNGKLCRLRDIQELFMGTGLGPESYAIIEQGRIGQILSSKPHDRRAIIEEAAGITRFKTKKRLAEARLEEARLNLARVNDIFEEVTRQMNSLKRQASKAERYGRLRDEMRGRLRVVLGSKFLQMEQENAHMEAQLQAIAEQMRVEGERVQQLEHEHGERQQRGYALEQEARQHHDRLNAIVVEIDRAAARRRHNEERCAELAARSAAAEAELAQAAAHLASLEAERESNRAVLESAAADVAAAQREAALRQQEAQAAAAALLQVEREQEERRAEFLQAMADAAAVRNQMIQEEERLAALERESQRVSQEMTAARDTAEAFGGRRGQIAFEFETISARVAGLASQIEENRALLAQKKTAESDAKQRLDGLRAEYAGALGRKASLEALIAEHGYSTDSVRRLFQSNAVSSGFAPVGVLADFLEVEDKYEHVVEDFLRDELNYVVVKSWNSADEGLRLLRSDVDGRATFLVHPEDSQARFSFAVDENARPASFQGSLVPLKHCIRVLNGFGKSLEVILPKLRDGYIAPDPATARELALDNPDAFFLSQSGECFHNVTVTGGRQRSEGPLSMKRELRDLLRQITELEHALRSAEATVGTLGREIADLGSLLDRLESDRRLAEKQALTSESGLQQLDAELERLRQRLATHQSELQRLDAERGEKQERSSRLREQLAGCEQRRQELEQLSAVAQESLVSLRAARDLAATAASERMARVAALDERRIAAAAALQRIEALAIEAAGRVGSLRGQLEAATAETEQRTAENAALSESLLALTQEQEAGHARDLELQAESEQVRARLTAIEQELRVAREQLDAARDRRGELAAAIARLQSDAQHMAETCLNELGLAREQLLAESTGEPLQSDALAQEEAAYREMRARLDAMGPVNMMALEEYNETAQRHAFLETQRKDLLDSIENTQNTIREIDTVSREKFQEAFGRINENFQLTFRKLFGGGQAFMRLTDEENTAESGIDVVASPPGKRLQNVLLLSGGEKALTALALLVGIFQYQPSPFCVLDEVDAPLDEANVGRFTELVRELSVHTQFVLITHSKKTMSMAPVMYGVTMQEPGVSKLVSVRFGAEAAAHA